MDPYQPYQSPNQGNPYDFILNPQPAAKKKFGFGGSNFLMTIGLIIGGALLLIIVLAVLLSAFAPKSVGTADLITMAQVQNELIRVADQGARSGTQQATKNLGVTIQYTMQTQQKQTLTFLSQNGTNLGEKDLKLKQNASTDQQLTSAKTTSTFDLVFADIMENELTTYSNDLKQLYSKAASKKEKDLMSSFYEQTQLLISQIPYTQDKIESAGQ
ncbi:MAG TPA: hypothetical protein VFM05_01825 [Candidatus Saccharimonadales bacterium]|nr:hypothetical protein [Candidatus Saccharimonadales bacterium]